MHIYIYIQYFVIMYDTTHTDKISSTLINPCQHRYKQIIPHSVYVHSWYYRYISLSIIYPCIYSYIQIGSPMDTYGVQYRLTGYINPNFSLPEPWTGDWGLGAGSYIRIYTSVWIYVSITEQVHRWSRVYKIQLPHLPIYSTYIGFPKTGFDFLTCMEGIYIIYYN